MKEKKNPKPNNQKTPQPTYEAITPPSIAKGSSCCSCPAVSAGKLPPLWPSHGVSLSLTLPSPPKQLQVSGVAPDFNLLCYVAKGEGVERAGRAVHWLAPAPHALWTNTFIQGRSLGKRTVFAQCPRFSSLITRCVSCQLGYSLWKAWNRQREAISPDFKYHGSLEGTEGDSNSAHAADVEVRNLFVISVCWG